MAPQARVMPNWWSSMRSRASAGLEGDPVAERARQPARERGIAVAARRPLLPQPRPQRRRVGERIGRAPPPGFGESAPPRRRAARAPARRRRRRPDSRAAASCRPRPPARPSRASKISRRVVAHGCFRFRSAIHVRNAPPRQGGRTWFWPHTRKARGRNGPRDEAEQAPGPQGAPPGRRPRGQARERLHRRRRAGRLHPGALAAIAQAQQQIGDRDVDRADLVARAAQAGGRGRSANSGKRSPGQQRRQHRADRSGVDAAVGVAARLPVDRADVQAGAAADAAQDLAARRWPASRCGRCRGR